MKRIVVLGGTGMLGSAVVKYFTKRVDIDLFYSYRNYKATEVFHNRELRADVPKKFKFDPLVDDLSVIPPCDFVINCIGTIKPFMYTNIAESIYINSVFPHKLADFCERDKSKLIHITSDCVFSGKDGNYNEGNLHDALDDYGKSKSLGEPKNCMVLRTSIIGEEIHKNASLISWVKSQNGKKVKGFTNHIFQGLTTNHLAECFGKIIDNNLFETGTKHIFSPTPINKFELVKMISDKYNLDLDIEPFETEQKVDRSLSTKYDLCSKLEINELSQQIKDL